MLKTPIRTALATLSIVFILSAQSADSSLQSLPEDGPVPYDQSSYGQIFSDVNVGDKHYLAIKFLKERHIIDGYEDGTFKPTQDINRAEALKIILNTVAREPSKDKGGTTGFSRSREKDALKRKIEPRPVALSTVMRPPMRCTNFCEIASPRPVPP